MRHGKKFNHLGRTASHRNAMLSNMATSLIMEKRISTTVAKAKALRKYVEPLLTKSKEDSTHSRRVVFSYLQDKESVSELFNNVADKIANRPGGYTRILKTGNRLGDNADMCIIELVDYNEALLKEAKPAKAKTRRSRRGKGGASSPAQEGAEKATASETPVAEEAVVVEETKTEESPEAPVEEPTAAEEKIAETAEATEEVVAETAESTEEVVAEAEETTEDKAEASPEESSADDAKEEASESDEEEPKKE